MTHPRSLLRVLPLLGLAACGHGTLNLPDGGTPGDIGSETKLTLVSNESLAAPVLSGSYIDEHCAIPSALVASLGLAPPEQLRIRIDASHYALCTVVSGQDAPSPDKVVMTRAAIGDKGLIEGAVVSLGKDVVSPAWDAQPTWADWRGLVSKAGDFAERTVTRAGTLGSGKTCVAIAPHGGDIDASGTDLQAVEVGEHLDTIKSGSCSVWAAAGFANGSSGNPHDIWHTTATEISTASFPKLATLIGTQSTKRFDEAVAFHAMSSTTAGCTVGGDKCQKVYVGGGIDGTPVQTALVAHLKTRLAQVSGGAGVSVEAPPAGSSVAGSSTKNIINRMATSDRGIHLEQTAYVITNFGTAIADAVADFMATQ